MHVWIVGRHTVAVPREGDVGAPMRCRLYVEFAGLVESRCQVDSGHTSSWLLIEAAQTEVKISSKIVSGR